MRYGVLPSTGFSVDCKTVLLAGIAATECMSNLPIPKPDPYKSSLNQSPETDLTELAALFAAKSGAGVSPKLSTELALEIVLNEIVEQACLATGATGAAVILEREGEMVCRATTGPTAPELGSHPDSESGLTAECLRTGQVRLCNDAQNDARADAEASRNIGVRSVIGLPLIQDGAVIGVLEAFSSRPAAFGDRDQLTLAALVERILKNLRRASDPILAHTMKPPASDGVRADNATANRVPQSLTSDGDDIPENPTLTLPVPPGELSAASATEQKSKSGVDLLTLVLAAACIACLLLIVTLVVVRVTSRKTSAESRPAASEPVAPQTNATPNAAVQPLETGQPQPSSQSPASPQGGSDQNSPTVPPGGLAVYENGKEVFRLPPSSAAGEKTARSATTAQPEEVINLSPDAAKSSLIYRQEPEYPEEARRQGIQGPVVLDVGIGRDGAVQNATLVSGQEILGNAAIAAVKQWRFQPHYSHGRPAEMQTRITLNFRLPQ